MIVVEAFLNGVVYEQTGVVCSDIQQAVGVLVQGVYIGRLYRHCNIPVFTGRFLQQIQPVGRTYPYGILVSLLDVRYGFQSGNQFYLLMLEIYLLQVVVTARPYIAFAVLGNGTDIFVGANRLTAE